MPRLQTPRLQTGVFQTVITVACGHRDICSVQSTLFLLEYPASKMITYFKFKRLSAGSLQTFQICRLSLRGLARVKISLLFLPSFFFLINNVIFQAKNAVFHEHIKK